MTRLRSLRATSAEDLLALVPSLLGFHPEDSLVLLTVGAAGTPFHARADLPAHPEDVPSLADHLTRVAVRNGMRRGAVVVYAEEQECAEAAGAALVDALLLDGVEVVCALRVDGRHWCRLGQEGPGTTYDLASHPFTLQAVVDGTVVLGSRQDVVDSLACTDPDEVERIAALAEAELDRLKDALASGGPSGPVTSEGEAAHCGEPRLPPGGAPCGTRRVLGDRARWVSARVRRFVEDGERLDETDVARLATAVTVHVDVRDVAWAEITRPDASQHVDLWRDVVRRTPVELGAAPSGLLGMAAWLAGDGALAWCAVDRAQRADPDHNLARLLGDLLTDGVPPSAWEPLPREALSVLTE